MSLIPPTPKTPATCIFPETTKSKNLKKSGGKGNALGYLPPLNSSTCFSLQMPWTFDVSLEIAWKTLYTEPCRVNICRMEKKERKQL
jgi:hypothetical protein